jgi:hypothetical protein
VRAAYEQSAQVIDKLAEQTDLTYKAGILKAAARDIRSLATKEAAAVEAPQSFAGKISGGEYDRDADTMYITVKMPAEGLPVELKTIGALVQIAQQSPRSDMGGGRG